MKKNIIELTPEVNFLWFSFILWSTFAVVDYADLSGARHKASSTKDVYNF